MALFRTPVAAVTLAAFFHSNLLWAWMPTTTNDGESTIPKGLKPLYQDSGSDGETYYIYFDSKSRRLLWQVVPVATEVAEELYYQIMPNDVYEVTASLFKDSRVYIAGKSIEKNWFIRAFNPSGDIAWSLFGNTKDIMGIPKNIHFYKLELDGNLENLHVLGKVNDTNFGLILKAKDGNIDQATKLPKRKLLHAINETDNSDESLFPDPEERARIIIVEWIGGVIGVVSGVTLITGLGAFLYSAINWHNKQVVKAKTNEKERRHKELDFINNIMRHPFIPSTGHSTLGLEIAPPILQVPSPLDGSAAQKQVEVTIEQTIEPFESQSHEIELATLPSIAQAIPTLEAADPQEQNIESINSVSQTELTDQDIILPPPIESPTQAQQHENNLQDLFEAILNGNQDAVLQILTQSPSLVNQADDNGYTPLHYYAETGSFLNNQIAQILLEHGADQEAFTNSGYTPLHIAAMRDNFLLLRMLLDWKSEFSRDEVSYLFHIAVRYPSYGTELLNFLIQRNLHKIFKLKKSKLSSISTNQFAILGQTGATILHEAASVNNIEIIEFIVTNTLVDVNEQDDSGNTPLHIAVIRSNYEAVEKLLNYEASVRKTDNHGLTALHRAAQKRNYKIIITLLKAGANPNDVDDYGYTPLHIAVERGHIYVVRILAGSTRLNRTNKAKRNLLHLAAIANQHGLIEAIYNSRHHIFWRDLAENSDVEKIEITSGDPQISGEFAIAMNSEDLDGVTPEKLGVKYNNALFLQELESIKPSAELQASQ